MEQLVGEKECYEEGYSENPHPSCNYQLSKSVHKAILLSLGAQAHYVRATTTRGNYANRKFLSSWWSTEYTGKYGIE